MTVLEDAKPPKAPIDQPHGSQLPGQAQPVGREKGVRKRIQLDFSEKAYGELELMLKDAPADSVAEFCRQATKFYRWYLKEKIGGSQFLVKRGNEIFSVETVF